MRLLPASLAGLLVLSLASLAALALDFPALTGRVVDQAAPLADLQPGRAEQFPGG